MARLFLCLGKKHGGGGGQVKNKYKIWKLLGASFLDPCTFSFWSGSRVAHAGPEFLILVPSSLTCWDYMGMCHFICFRSPDIFFLLECMRVNVWQDRMCVCMPICMWVHVSVQGRESMCTEAQSCCVFLDHSHDHYGPRTPSSASLS